MPSPTSHRASAVLVVSALVASAAACSGGHDGGVTEPPPATVSSIAMSPPSAPIASLEDTVRLVATPERADGTPVTGVTISWTSSDANVASVTSSGTVTGHHNGTVTVTASAGSASAQTTVTVQQVPAKLAFVVQPKDVRANAAFAAALQVQVQDAHGTLVQGATTPVTLAPTGANAGPLTGTTTVAAVNGVATFTNVSVARAITGMTLTASATGTTTQVQSVMSAPFDVALDVVEISAGFVTACARTTDGTAYCWGNNAGGRVGDGTTTNRAQPVAVTGGIKFTHIDAGAPLTCGIAQGGALYCWGETDVANNANSISPTLISSPVPLSSIVIGWHGCGLDAGNVPYCWGDATYAIGAGPSNGYALATPTRALGGVPLRSVAMGIAFTCGVPVSGGPICAGDNPDGELGDGNTTTTNYAMPVAGGLDLSVVTAGDNFACGLTSAGAAWCWGSNGDGQLGTGSAGGNSTIPVAVQGGRTFTSIDAGGHTVCGLTSDGTAYCWGRGGYGQLGTGLYQSSATPVAVTGHHFTSVSVGGYHTCGIATDGFTYCWGDNYNGALGNGGAGPSNVPVRIAPPAS